MTRPVHNIIDGLRNAYGESNTSEIACEARALIAHIDRLEQTLCTVERWANHHARKPATTAEEALGVIQHHPVIRAITAGYADGATPDTPDPYAEIARLQRALDAERSRCAAICRDEADKCAAAADRSEEHEPDEVDALKATAWKLIVAQDRIEKGEPA